tara:strand:- start:2447 stop:2884 length:438 start_codon:yes stop_codon:yes gene_type:complete
MEKIYQQSLDNIFGKKRVVVSIIHNNKDLNIYSNEREILKAIKKNQMDNYNIDWFFKETIFGKSIYIDLNNINTHISSNNINFLNIERDYKDYFIHRINIIMDSTNNIKNNQFNNYVDEFNKLIKKDNVDFEEYKNIRNNFEKYN